MEDQKGWADFRRQWREVHLGIYAATLEIRAIEVTNNATGEAPMLPCLLDQIPADKIVASVSGDATYDTKGCHEAVAKRGAQPIIPTHKNAKLWKDQGPSCHSPQRHLGVHASAWQENLKEVERLSPAQPCRDQDAMLQTAW